MARRTAMVSRAAVVALILASASARFTEQVEPSLSYQPELYKASVAARRKLAAATDGGGTPASVPCNTSVIGAGNTTYGALYCSDDYDVVAANGDYAEVAPALGNTEYFQSPSTVYYASNANSSVTSYSIYNVHATPSNAGTPSSPAVLISWAGGLPTIGPISSVWPSATAPATGPGGAFNSSATGTVYLSTTSNLVNGATPGPSAYTAGSFTAVAVQYLRNYTSTSANTDNSGTYNWGVPANFCYLSGNQFHALATGLTPNTRYYYVVGNASGYSKEFSFTTPPAPAAASTYPFSLGLIADVGQTVNTSLGLTALAAMKPKLVLNVGDLTYADTYNECNSTFGFSQWNTSYGLATFYEGAGNTCQVRWDSFLAVPGTQALFGSALVINAAGNHEIEKNGVTYTKPTYNAATISGALYQSYAARFPSGALSTAAATTGGIGDVSGTSSGSASQLWYSQNIGPVHVLVLNAYAPYVPGTPQYAFALADLAAVNRAVTPWLIVMHHAPLYTTYWVHYKDSECFKEIYESLYAAYGVDFVISGHVHAYERSHPVYKYQRDACGPVYLSLGDGGNVEGPYRSFVDDVDLLSSGYSWTNGSWVQAPGSTNITYCASQQSQTLSKNLAGTTFAGGVTRSATGPGTSGNEFSAAFDTSMWGPSYQKYVNAPSCTGFTYQPGGGSVTGAPGGLLLDAAGTGGYFCQSAQPVFSAHRDPSFGFSFLNITSANTATFNWYRTIDGGTLAADTVTYTRNGACAAAATSSTAVPANTAQAAAAETSELRCATYLNSAAGGASYWGLASCIPSAAGVNYTTCCPALRAIYGAGTSSLGRNCLCEAEFAAFVIGALGSAGGTAKGSIPGYALGVGATGPSGLLQQCAASGTVSPAFDVYWLTGYGSSNANDCSAAGGPGLQLPSHPFVDSVRLPYVMNVTSTSAVIRWRTAAATATVSVKCGTSAASLNSCSSGDLWYGSAATIDHYAWLGGLNPGTVYYYSVAGPNGTATGKFKTALAAGAGSSTAATNLRFFVMGDYGSQSASAHSINVMDSQHQALSFASWLAFEAATGRQADAWLSLGDTVYYTGSDALFQYDFFNVYAPLIARAPVWPSIGNHDTYSWLYNPALGGTMPGVTGNFPYVSNVADSTMMTGTGYGVAFGSSLPQNGEALNGGPGVASGTWRFYSFNYGRVHFVVLDSMSTRTNNSVPWAPNVGLATYPSPATSLPSLGASLDATWASMGSPRQAAWAAADLATVLAAGQTDFVVVNFHHPAYSAGSHHSDTEIELIEMRTLYAPILEAGGADICFSGHSHGYERMVPTVGFTGTQAAFAPANAAPNYTPQTTNFPATHVKPAGLTPRGGTTYMVVGSGGQYSTASGAASGANYKFVSSAIGVEVSSNDGSVALDIVGGKLTTTFIAGGSGAVPAGTVLDTFVICKAGAACAPPPVVAPITLPKDNNTLVYASFGDWGWGAGNNNSLLLSASAAGCIGSQSTNFNSGANCYSNSGAYIMAGVQQVAQKAVANAMGMMCQAYGGCDFIINTGDNFYDLGIIGGLSDPQWTNSYLNVYTHPGLKNVPILGTLGNHDYSILANNSAASEIAYTSVDPSGRWYIPAHNYQRVFTSASGAVSAQVVSIDSTPLHDRYLYSGGSGGGYATGANGPDTLVNSPATNYVINPGVSSANGFSNGNYFNASNYQCYYNFATATTNGFTTYAGATSYPGTSWKTSSGCKYASAEIAPLASPAARAATWANVSSWFTAGYGQYQYQIMMSHFPVLSTQQRLTPYYDNATATFAALGNAAPQVYYNGHDHVMAAVTAPAITTAGGAPIVFVTSGAAGVSDYLPGTAPGFNGVATGAAAAAAAQNPALGGSNGPMVPQPPSGTAAKSAAYNPDVGGTTFWSALPGFTMQSLNATFLRVDFFVLNCKMVPFGVGCDPVPIGPLNTTYIPAKASGGSAPVFLSSSVTLGGYTPASWGPAQSASFCAGVNSALKTSNCVVTGVTAGGASGRHLLQSSVVVMYTVQTTLGNSAALSATMASPTGPLASASTFSNAGLTAVTSAAPSTAPPTKSTAAVAAPPPPMVPPPPVAYYTLVTGAAPGRRVAAAATLAAALLAALL